MTDVILSKLEHAFKIGCTNTEACAYAEISEDPFYKYIAANEDFKEDIERWKHNPILLARGTVTRGISTDKELAFKYLSKRRPEEFTDKITLDATVTEVDISKMTATERLEYIKSLSR